jgi:hypothetical protein
VLAGVWLLVLLPLADALGASGWASRLRVPALFEHGASTRALDQTFAFHPSVYQPLVFCTGLVLLFSRERGRQRSRLDRTRPWGVLCCYAVLPLAAAQVLFIAALVLVGIAAAFLSMPLENQPRVTRAFAAVGAAYLHYGPYPSDESVIVLVAFSSAAVLLACVPLYEALRGAGLRRAAAVLVAPLAALAAIYLAQVGWHALSFPRSRSADVLRYGEYFEPGFFFATAAELRTGGGVPGWVAVLAFVEAVKWSAVLAIAVALTAAQLAASKVKTHASRDARS